MATRLLLAILVLPLAGCDYLEERRLAAEIERDLSVRLSARLNLLLTETYGWAEEGGDRALLSLGKIDCDSIAERMNATGMYFPESDAERMFREAARSATAIRSRLDMEPSGDHTTYYLDSLSCTLFRGAHFE